MEKPSTTVYTTGNDDQITRCDSCHNWWSATSDVPFAFCPFCAKIITAVRETRPPCEPRWLYELRKRGKDIQWTELHSVLEKVYYIVCTETVDEFQTSVDSYKLMGTFARKAQDIRAWKTQKRRYANGSLKFHIEEFDNARIVWKWELFDRMGNES